MRRRRRKIQLNIYFPILHIFWHIYVMHFRLIIAHSVVQENIKIIKKKDIKYFSYISSCKYFFIQTEFNMSEIRTRKCFSAKRYTRTSPIPLQCNYKWKFTFSIASDQKFIFIEWMNEHQNIKKPSVPIRQKLFWGCAQNFLATLFRKCARGVFDYRFCLCTCCSIYRDFCVLYIYLNVPKEPPRQRGHTNSYSRNCIASSSSRQSLII